jgi:hypothetical protein
MLQRKEGPTRRDKPSATISSGQFPPRRLKRWRHWPTLFLGLFLIGLLVRPVPILRGSSAQNTGHLVYLGPNGLYCDRGRLSGLKPGDQYDIFRQGQIIARMEIVRCADHFALARIVHSLKRPTVNDIFFPAEMASGQPTLKRPKIPTIPGNTLSTVWQEALRQQPTALVPFKKSENNVLAHNFHGQAETVFAASSYFDDADAMTKRQRISLWAVGKNVLWPGLKLKLSGTIEGRYDSEPDRYRPGDRFIPYFREVSLQYSQSRQGFVTALGRFRNQSRLVGIVDGAEIGWQNQQVAVTTFAGLRPGYIDMSIRPDHRIYGLSLKLHPDVKPILWSLSSTYLGEYREGRVARNAVAVDNMLIFSSRLELYQTATVDIVSPHNASGQAAGLDVSEMAIALSSRLSSFVSLNGSLRYDQPYIASEEISVLPTEWLNWLDRERHIRWDGAVQLHFGPSLTLAPYLYAQSYRQSLFRSANDPDMIGAGLSYQQRLTTTLSLSSRAEYASGETDQANLFFNLSSPLTRFLWAALGMHSFWSEIENSSQPEWQQALFLDLQGEIFNHCMLWVNASATTDRITQLTALNWWFSQMGLRYEW